MENSHAQTLSLSNLEEGTYQFKLIVSGGSPPVEGEAFGNVTVIPGTNYVRINALFGWDGIIIVSINKILSASFFKGAPSKNVCPVKIINSKVE